jgi:plastocyanin
MSAMKTLMQTTRLRARRRIVGAVAALAFVTLGLGCGAKADLESAMTDPNEVVVIDMTDALTFVPRDVRVQVGQQVRWRNVSRVVHTVTADPSRAGDPAHVNLPRGAEPFDTGDIAPGLEYSRKFSTPGRYEYFSVPHEAAGMLGTVEVVGSTR